MAITLEHKNTIGLFPSNYTEKMYKAVCDNSYPDGGYEIGAAQYPADGRLAAGINPFRKLFRSGFDESAFSESMNYMGKLVKQTFADGSDPKIKLVIFDQATGTSVWAEITPGTDLTDEYFYLVIGGAPVGMCDADPGVHV